MVAGVAHTLCYIDCSFHSIGYQSVSADSATSLGSTNKLKVSITVAAVNSIIW